MIWFLRILALLLLGNGIMTGVFMLAMFVEDNWHFRPPHIASLTRQMEDWARMKLDIARQDPELALKFDRSMEREAAMSLWVLDGTGQEVFGRELPAFAGDCLNLVREGGAFALPAQEFFSDPEATDMVVAAAFDKDRLGQLTVLALLGGEPAPPAILKNGYIRHSLALALAVLLLYGLSRLNRPAIRSIRSTIRRLADGDFSARLDRTDGHRSREEQRLIREFNHMAENIEDLLCRRRTLLAELVHDMNSPLARMALAVELAKRGKENVPLECLERIQKDSNCLAEMSRQLLRMASDESPRHGALTVSLDICRLARESVRTVSFEARANGIRIETDIPRQPLLLDCDGEALKRSLDNVLRNALKYSPAGSLVRISLSPSDMDGLAACELRIADTGRGVPSGELGRIFQPHYRASNTGTVPGQGLGLSQVRRTASRQGGQVRAEKTPGGGLTIILRLPLRGEGTAPDFGAEGVQPALIPLEHEARTGDDTGGNGAFLKARAVRELPRRLSRQVSRRLGLHEPDREAG